MPEEVFAQPNVNVDLSTERKKPRLLSLLFCDFASITKDDKVNLLGIFDRIYIDPEQKTTPNFVIFIRVGELAEGFATTVFGPDDLPVLQLFSVPQEPFTPNLPRQVQTLITLRLKVEKEGVYWFDISYRGASLGGAGLVIEYRKTEDKQSGTDTYI
jgi:hypothetical protein